jgi:hypothetical protein
MMRFANARRFAAVLLAALAAGCGDVTQSDPVAQVAVEPAAATLAPGGTVQLSARVTDGAGQPVAGRTVTWSTSAPAVAEVDATGRVTALATGQATITAASGGQRATVTVTVGAPVASLALAPGQLTLLPGASERLAATARDAGGAALAGRVVAWTSSNPAVAAVSATGVVTGVAPGTATVTASAEGKNASATVEVATLVPGYALVSYATGGTRLRSLAAGDLNGDGLADLVVANEAPVPGIFVFYRNAENTGFAPPVRYGAGAVPTDVAIGDLDGDGRADLAVTDAYTGAVLIFYRNSANDGYAAPSTVQHLIGLTSVAIADVDGDGRNDLATAGYGSPGSTQVLVSRRGPAGFGPSRVAYTGIVAPALVIAGDLTGDGLPELVVSYDDPAFGPIPRYTVLTRNSNDYWTPNTRTAPHVVQQLAIADMDLDGTPDVVAGGGMAASYGIDARYALWHPATPNVRIVARDLDGNGVPDLAIGTRGPASGVSIAYSSPTPPGYYGLAIPIGSGVDTEHAVASADFNGDGRPDLAVTSSADGTITVLYRR